MEEAEDVSRNEGPEGATVTADEESATAYEVTDKTSVKRYDVKTVNSVYSGVARFCFDSLRSL